MFLSPGSRARARLMSLWKASGTTIAYSGGKVQISGDGMSTAISQLEITQTWVTALSSNLMATFTSYGDVARFAFRQASGTRANPSAISSGTIGVLTYRGFDGSTFATSAQISGSAQENFSGSAHGTALIGSTVALGSTILTESFRANPSGGLGVGTGSTDPGAGNIAANNFVTAGGYTRVTSDVGTANNVTLTAITGLTVNVAAGKTYGFHAVLFTNSNVAGGIQVSVGGTCTATALVYEAQTTDGAAIKAQNRAAALNTSVGGFTAVTNARVEIWGTITVNAAGTLRLNFAQNASNAGNTTVQQGSWFKNWLMT